MHEEADTKIFVHVRHMVKQGAKSILIKSGETDVVVLAINAVVDLRVRIWIAFGTGKNVW